MADIIDDAKAQSVLYTARTWAERFAQAKTQDEKVAVLEDFRRRFSTDL